MSTDACSHTTCETNVGQNDSMKTMKSYLTRSYGPDARFEAAEIPVPSMLGGQTADASIPKRLSDVSYNHNEML